MNMRSYDPERDRDPLWRIWQEIGWGNEDHDRQSLDTFLTDARTLVSELDGVAECHATAVPGVIRYQDRDLRLSVVGAVATSRVARQQGFAKRLTAQLLAEETTAGAQVSILGMFDQGFYDQLGFGTGPYDLMRAFDPATLQVDPPSRPPVRLGGDDWEQIHDCRARRQRGHGGCCVDPASFTRSELQEWPKGFGLGFRDGPNGALTHFFYCKNSGELGPYFIRIMAWQTWEQFRELLGLVKSLADQVQAVHLVEPAGIQFQDFIARPFRHHRMASKSEWQHQARAIAWWQARICDLHGCLAETHLPGPTVRFNLQLTDPIESQLDDSADWRGIGGEYVVALGESSSAKAGSDAALPTLKASVNAFTRMWLGVLPASGLAAIDDFSGPSDLLTALDAALRLPKPWTGIDF